MLESTAIRELRRALRRQGIWGARAERLLQEWTDHVHESVARRVADGTPAHAAEQSAWEALGQPHVLAASAAQQLARSSWLGRHPWLAGLVFPLLGGLCAFLSLASEKIMTGLPAIAALLLLPALAVWLTAAGVASLPARWPARIAFWLPTVLGWAALLILLQARAEDITAVRPVAQLSLELAGLMSVCFIIKGRWPSWRVVGEVSGSLLVLVGVAAVLLWGYETRTQSLAARAEARWSEIGHPMAEFEKALGRSHENAGSQVLRQILRAQANAPFYKAGTPAAQFEPKMEPSPETTNRIKEAVEVISQKLPPSDDIDLSSQSVALLDSASAALDESYRRMLDAEPAAWACDPHDGFTVSVPNFLGIRQLSQVIAADALRRLSTGDQEGAARALAAGLRVRKGLVENPTLVSLMIAVAVDGLLFSQQVRLPASEDGLGSLAKEVSSTRAEFLRRVQMEAWVALRHIRLPAADWEAGVHLSNPLPEWANKIVNPPWIRRQCAIAALNEAEHMAILESPATLKLPDLGDSLHEAISEANPSIIELNTTRAIKRIHAILLLREQTELIRNARQRLTAGESLKPYDSMVLPGLRWEFSADTEKGSVALRLAHAPEWIVKNEVTGGEFWLLPLDGSVAWQFHKAAHVTSRD